MGSLGTVVKYSEPAQNALRTHSKIISEILYQSAYRHKSIQNTTLTQLEK